MFQSISTIIFWVICLCSCSSENWRKYDKGYEAAWNQEPAPSSIWTSNEEKQGYADGLEDMKIYDEGYDAGYEGKRPKYPKDPLYMDGYKDGKKDKL